MADRARIALINPRFQVRPGMPVHLEYEPIGLLMLSAAMKKSGFETRLFEQPPDLPAESLARRVMDWLPDSIGFSVYTANFPEGRRIASCLKGLGYAGSLVFGGIHASTAPDVALEPAVDYVLRGEGEEAGPLLFDAVINGGSVSDIPGVVYKQDGCPRETAPFKLIEDLTSLPWADRSEASIRREYSLGAYGYPKAIVMTSRGCRMSCTFCTNASLTRRRVRYRDPADVADEIGHLKTAHGIRFIYFGDAEFFSNAEHTAAVCSELIRRRTDVPFCCMGGIDCLDGDLLDLLASAGCIRLFVGLERPPGETRWTSKARNRKSTDEILRLARAKGITTQVGFMIGFPDEDRQSLAGVEAYVKEMPADYLSVTVATPFHGTELRNSMLREGIELSPDERRYTYDSPAFRHPSLSADELTDWRKKLYRSFYLGGPHLRRVSIKLLTRPALGLDYARLFYKSVREGLFS